TERPTSP
ncbi:collagenase family protease domain protein, partial [Vibrio parahaemolyticus V-223/04]